jgi:hypothetical protein
MTIRRPSARPRAARPPRRPPSRRRTSSARSRATPPRMSTAPSWRWPRRSACTPTARWPRRARTARASERHLRRRPTEAMTSTLQRNAREETPRGENRVERAPTTTSARTSVVSIVTTTLRSRRDDFLRFFCRARNTRELASRASRLASRTRARPRVTPVLVYHSCITCVRASRIARRGRR